MGEDQYTIVEDVIGPGAGDAHDLVDYQTEELVSVLWSKYLARAREAAKGAVEVREDVWSAVEEIEGRRIAVAER